MAMAARSLTRFLPLALAGAAAASVWMFWDVPWRRAEPEVCALLAAAVLGGASTALRAKGWKRTARALAGAVLVGALGLVAHRVDAGSGWVDLAAQLVTITGPLAIATFALVGTRDSAGFALGAALVAVVTPWYFWAMPALLVLGFVFGRDALSGRSPRNAISTAGAGALAMLLVTAIGFDLGAFLVDTYRPGMMSLRGYVDGPLTFVPRVAVEGALLAGCLAHDSRGTARADTFYLPRISLGASNSLRDITGRAMLIHEATHAIQDQQAAHAHIGMPKIIAETTAYVAQALYYRLYGDTFRARSLELRQRNASGGEPMSAVDRRAGDRLLDAVEPVAERLFVAGGGPVHDDEYDRIKRAISGHPNYAGRVYEPAGFDGIGVHHAP